MNIGRMKLLLWIVALILGGYLAFYVSEFFKEKPELERGISEERQYEVLRDGVEPPEPPKDNVVAYEDVRRVFHGMNWTGKLPPPPPKPTEGGDKPKEVPKTPVSELLSVLYLQEDLSEPEKSLAYVSYQDAKLAAKAKSSEDYLLRVGEKLAKPHAYITVAAITAEGVRFRFDEEEREAELVPLSADDSYEGPRITRVVDGKAIEPERRSGSIRKVGDAPAFRPQETTQIGQNHWLLGTETMTKVERDYSAILSRDLRYRTKRGADGRVKGIEVTHVATGSIPEQHGVTPGEILKSINGHPVTGVNDAIAYVKREADQTDTWVAVFEKFGREYTRTYTTPPE